MFALEAMEPRILLSGAPMDLPQPVMNFDLAVESFNGSEEPSILQEAAGPSSLAAEVEALGPESLSVSFGDTMALPLADLPPDPEPTDGKKTGLRQVESSVSATPGSGTNTSTSALPAVSLPEPLEAAVTAGAMAEELVETLRAANGPPADESSSSVVPNSVSPSIQSFFTGLQGARDVLPSTENSSIPSFAVATSPSRAPLPTTLNKLALSDYVAQIQAQGGSANQLLIVDGAVPEYVNLVNSLIASIAAQKGSASATSAIQSSQSETDFANSSVVKNEPYLLIAKTGDFQVVVLDSGSDGISQISQILRAHRQLEAIEILSHGGPGQLRLGTSSLDSSTLTDRQTEIAAWGQSLKFEGDLLLFGCDVAVGESGVRFVQDLASTTGADVAASTNATGAADLGGDWNLEFQTGPVRSLGFQNSALAYYNSLLASLGSLSSGGELTLFTGSINRFKITRVAASINGGEILKVENLDTNQIEQFGTITHGVKSILAESSSGTDELDFTAGGVVASLTLVGKGANITVLGQVKSLTLNGSDGNDVINLSADGAGKMKLTVGGGTLKFENPSDELVINGQAGNDIITIISMGSGFAAALSVFGHDADSLITFSEFDRFVIAGNVSTLGQDFTARADQITINPGVILSTNAPPPANQGDPENDAGNLEFRARNVSNADLTNFLPLDFVTRKVSIEVGAGAEIHGKDITLLAQGEDRGIVDLLGTDRAVSSWVIEPLLDLAQGLLALPVKVLRKTSEATVNLRENVKIIASGAAAVNAVSGRDSSGKVVGTLVGIGYVEANASSIINVETGVTITAERSVQIGSEASASAEIDATAQQLARLAAGVVQVSLAVSNASVVSRTTVAEGASITAGTIVNIRSIGSKKSVANATAALDEDGKAGLSFAVQLSKADVVTTVNGSVTGNLNLIDDKDENVVVLRFDPGQTSPDPLKPGYIDTVKDTIFVGPYALESEDTVIYRNYRGASIGGLTDGQKYFIIKQEDDPNTTVDESQTIQLAETEKQAIDGEAIDLYTLPLVEYTDEQKFNASDVNSATDTIRLNINGIDSSSYALAQSVVYKQGTAPITGLVDGERYYVIAETSQYDLEGDTRFVNIQTIQLARTAAEARAGLAIDLTASYATATGFKLVADQVLDSGFSLFGVVSRLTTEDGVTATTGIEKSTASGLITEGITEGNLLALYEGLTKFYKSKEGSGGSGASGGLSMGGALSFGKVSNNVQTIIGADAVLKSNGDMDIQSTISQRFQNQAESNVEPAEGVASAVSVAVVIGLYQNTAQTTIETGAQLDALRAMRINSKVAYPFFNRPDEIVPLSFNEFFDQLTADGPSAVTKYLDGTGGLKSELFNTWVRSTAKADTLSVAGSVSYTQFDNVTEVIVKPDALINQDTDFRSASNTHANQSLNSQVVMVEAETQTQVLNLTGTFDFSLPTLPSLKDVSLSPVGSGSARGGFGGAIFLSFLNNQTHALIQTGAKIYTGDNGGLNVTAEETLMGFNFTQAGANAGKWAIGASFSYVEQNSDTLALIGSGAVISGGRVKVYAGSAETLISWVGGVAAGKAIGVGAAVAIHQISRKTNAVVGELAGVTDPAAALTGQEINIDTAAEISVKAKNEGALWAFTVAGAVVSNSPQAPAPEDPLADASAKNGPPPAAGAASSAPPAKTGIGVAGAVALNFINDQVNAGMTRVSARAARSSVSAENRTKVYASTGALAFAKVAAGTVAASLAGAFSKNKLSGTTRALVRKSNLTLSGGYGTTFEVSAERKGYLFALAAGGAGALATGTPLAFSVAGSVSLNDVISDTQALLDNSVVDVSEGDVSITASDRSEILAIGGAVALSVVSGTIPNGSAVAVAAGVALAINDINVSVSAQSLASQVTISSAGNATLSASGTESIKAVTLAGALSASNGTGGNGIAGSGVGSGSVNYITSNLLANLQGGSFTTVSGNVSISVTDSPTIFAVAGGIAVALAGSSSGIGGAAAVGVSFAANSIRSTALADVNASTLDVSGILTVSATGGGEITSLTKAGSASAALSGQGAGLSFSGAGSVSVNKITGNVKARLSNNTVVTKAGTRLDVLATDSSSILANSGASAYAVGASIKGPGVAGAVGASLAFNEITNTVQALIDGVSITESGALNVLAVSNSSIFVLSFGLAGSMAAGGTGGFSFAGAGSYAGNTISNTIEALVRGTTTVMLTGDALVKAADSSRIRSVVGATTVSVSSAPGGGAVAVGVSFAANTIENTVNASIDNSALRFFSGSLSVLAEQKSDIFVTSAAATVGVAAGSNAALTGGGAVARNVILSDARASITGSTIKPVTINIPLVGDVFGELTTVSVGVTNTSSIQAYVDTLAVSVAVSNGPAVSAAIGASEATNYIGYRASGALRSSENRAYILKSDVEASGAVSVTALTSQNIKALVVTGSVAVSGSTGGSAAGAGAGSTTKNRITQKVSASVEGDGTTVITSGSLLVSASDTSTINAIVDASTLAVSVSTGGASGAVAIGVALAENSIDNEVSATITGMKKVETLTAGVSVSAVETAKITAKSIASAAAAAFSPSFTLAAGSGAATSKNSIAGTVTASIDDVELLTAKTGVNVTADNTATLNANIDSYTLTAGFVGISIGVALADNTITTTTTAFVQDAAIVATGGDIVISARSTPKADTQSRVGALSASIGGSGAGAESNVTLNAVTSAYLNAARLTATGRAVNVTASSTATANPSTLGAAGGLVAVAAMVSNASIGGSTSASVRGLNTVTAGTLTISATDTSTASPSTLVGGVGGITGAGAKATTRITRTTEAYLAANTAITSAAPISVTAASTSSASGQTSAASAGAITLSTLIVDSQISSTTRASVGDGAQITAGGLTVSAAATNNVSAPVSVFGLGFADGASVEITAKDNSIVSASVGSELNPASAASVTITGGGVSVLANTASTVNASVDMLSIALAGSLSSTKINAGSTTSTSAFIGQQAAVSAPSGQVKVEAVSNGTVTAASKKTGGGAVAVAISEVLANATNTTRALLLGNVGSTTASGAASISVKADGTVTVNASASSTGGGLVSAASSRVEATTSLTVTAAGGGFMRSSGDISIRALGDNNGTATSSTSGGGALSVTGLNTKITSVSNVLTRVDANAVIIAGGALLIEAVSDGDITGDARGKTGGLITVGSTQSTVGLQNDVSVTVGAGAALTASRDATVRSNVANTALVDTDSSGGGVVTAAKAQSSGTMAYTSLVTLGSGAAITSDQTLLVQSLSAVDATADATSNSAGLAGGANSTASMSITGATTTTVGTNAQLTGAVVQVDAAVTRLALLVTANGKLSAAGGEAAAYTTAEFTDAVLVDVKGGARISGAQVVLTARHESISLQSKPTSDAAGFAKATAHSVGSYTSSSTVNADDGAVISTGDLLVKSTQAITTLKRDTSADGLDTDRKRSGDLTANRAIVFNADVLLGVQPVLIINEAGLVEKAVGVTVNNALSNATNIVVDAIAAATGAKAVGSPGTELEFAL